MTVTRYALFKYSLYLLVLIDCGWFMREDWLAAQPMLAAGAPTVGALVASFAQSVDTWAWLGLLALFELETGSHRRRAIAEGRRRLLHVTRLVCYVGVVYAAVGYLHKFALLGGAAALADGNPCAWSDSGTAWLHALDDYPPITSANCAALRPAGALWYLQEANLLADAEGLAAARRLALTDVINALAWILVGLVLEFEVWARSAARRRFWLRGLPLATKGLLYAILAGAAVYWGMAGSFLDFWDATLWIAAFVFIEINVFQWGDVS